MEMGMFHKIFVERQLEQSPRVKNILQRFPRSDLISIERMDQYFGKVKKPYLQKRDSLNLFLAHKRGTLVKKAPDAYGLDRGEHFYFLNAYNCIYECNYCYLQGYFHSPDIVLFLNYEDILREVERILEHRNKKDEVTWFHTGEFSDSLALSHLTDELGLYTRFFSERPMALLELRTKSANTNTLLSLEPCSNIIISFSLSPEDKIKHNDIKTPPLSVRLKAMKRLQDKGHRLAVHFDPIIYDDRILEKYRELLGRLHETLDLCSLEYFSLGVVRFTKSVYAQVKSNYPKSEFFSSELAVDKKGLVRYPRMMRRWMMNQIKNMIVSYGVDCRKVYLCME